MTELTFHVEPDAWLPVAELLTMFHPANSQTRNAEELGAIKRHLTDEGFTAEMIVVNPWNKKIVSGHGRTQAAHELGFTGKLPVVYREYPSEAAHRRAMLRWNLARGHQDPEKQAQEFADLLADFEKGDLAADFGMGDGEFAELLKEWDLDEEPPEDPGPQVDRAEELREKWGVETGQMWKLGAHRLICGDCTDAAVVERVMGGEKAGAVVTDPPYEMEPSQIRAALNLLSDRATLLLTGSQAYAMCADGWEYRMDFVWRHRQPRSFPTIYQPVMYHHPILIIAKPGAKTGWNRPRKDFSSVIEIDGPEFPRGEIGHAKSASLFVEMISGSDFDIWADPFIGAGTTLIACQKIDRRCFGIELNPANLAVAIERCNQMGLTPVRDTG